MKAGEPRCGWGDCPRHIPTSTMRRCLSVGRRWYLTTSSRGAHRARRSCWRRIRGRAAQPGGPCGGTSACCGGNPLPGWKAGRVRSRARSSLPASRLEKQAVTVIRNSPFYFFAWHLSSPSRDGIVPPPEEGQSLNRGTSRKSRKKLTYVCLKAEDRKQ